MFRKKHVVFVATIALAGCGHIYGEHGLIKKTSHQQYTQYRSEPALTLPPHLAKAQMQDYYPIPAVPQSSHTGTVSVVPPGEHGSALTTTQHRSLWTKVKDWF